MERDQILASLRERIVAYAASRVQRDAAEDLAQEVLMVLEAKYPRVEAPEELLPLAFQVLRFKMAGAVRKSIRRGEYHQVSTDGLSLKDPADDPEEAAARTETRDRLRAALLKLEPRCRELFRMKLEGRTFAEIQSILEVGSLNTIYTWDFRCRKQLLKLMGGRWETR